MLGPGNHDAEKQFPGLEPYNVTSNVNVEVVPLGGRGSTPSTCSVECSIAPSGVTAATPNASSAPRVAAGSGRIAHEYGIRTVQLNMPLPVQCAIPNAVSMPPETTPLVVSSSPPMAVTEQ